ncbi:MAG TPA: hypothetical protein DF383_02575, partial [Deltaproteobacteria bacterium]|nr:hypothetical protein [Deltaproteobacteria bacterium]
SACGKEVLQQKLTETDANEILVVLYQQGIDATKVKSESSQEVSYSITVPKNQIQNARKILVENNLPRPRELGSEGICKEKGLIPTPEEEKCRKLLAKKGDIINALQRVPGVINAEVVLNVPEISPFSAETQPSVRPTAAAVIRFKKSPEAFEITEARMQQFIAKSVENLDPRDVSVVITYVPTPQEILEQAPKTPTVAEPAAASADAKLAKIAGLVMQEESVKRFKIFAVVMLVLLLGVSAALILNVVKLTKLRQELKVSKLSSGLTSLPGAASPPLLEGGASAPLGSGEASSKFQV